MIKDYSIANIKIRLTSSDEYFHELMRDYEADIDTVDMCIDVLDFDDIDYVGKKVREGKGYVVYEDGDITHTYYMANGTCYASLMYDDGYDHCTLYLSNNPDHSGLTRHDIGYMFLGTLFSYKVTYFDGFSLHGSCIKYGNAGIIFTAPSGVGKSTQARLWKERYGDIVSYINDDKPALRREGDSLVAYGTPFSGKDHINTNISAPVKAIINVVRGEEDKIERLSMRESVVLFLEEMTRSTLNMDININTMKIIDTLLRCVPVYRLYCTPTQRAVEVTMDEIEEVL